MEQTIFFVKYRHLDFAKEIFEYLSSRIVATPGTPLINSKGLVRISEEGWRRFYEHIAKEFSEELAEMARDFAQHPIDLAILAGDNIVEPVKKLVGPMRYEDNSDTTIRGRWGPYDLPHTIVHASSREDVERERKILKEGLIEND